MRKTGGIPAMLLGGMLASCNLQAPPEEEPAAGTLGLRVNLIRAGALAKAAAGDTNFNLDSLRVVLTSPGQPTQTHAYAISGNAATGNVLVSTKYYTVAALRNWQAKIVSIDTTLNPSRRDTVHLDSISFYVKPADTTLVNPFLDPRYAVVRARYLANFPDSLVNTVKYIRLRVDGATRDSAGIGETGINGVAANSSTSLWAVGELGKILRTTNGGTNWTYQPSGTSRNLNGLSALNGSSLWAVGDSGLILTTANSGSSWNAQSSGTNAQLQAVYVATSSILYAAGKSGTILKTTNGGSTWGTQASGIANDLNSVWCISSTTVLAVGHSGTILKTTNGSTWSPKTSNTVQHLFSVNCANSSACWAAGDGGVILASTDGGDSWSAQGSGVSVTLKSVYFTSGTTGNAVGNSGTILKTTNGGSTWTTQTSGTTENLNVNFMSSATAAWALGGGIYKTTDGIAWTAQAGARNGGGKTFDRTLGYKYLIPGVSSTVVMQAIDTTAGALRGYEISKLVNVSPGQDTTLSTSLFNKCGYAGFPACTP